MATTPELMVIIFVYSLVVEAVDRCFSLKPQTSQG